MFLFFFLSNFFVFLLLFSCLCFHPSFCLILLLFVRSLWDAQVSDKYSSLSVCIFEIWRWKFFDRRHHFFDGCEYVGRRPSWAQRLRWVTPSLTLPNWWRYVILFHHGVCVVTSANLSNSVAITLPLLPIIVGSICHLILFLILLLLSLSFL